MESVPFNVTAPDVDIPVKTGSSKDIGNNCSLSLGDGLRLTLEDGLVEALGLILGLTERDALEDGETLRLVDDDGLTERDELDDGLSEADGLTDALAELLGLIDGDTLLDCGSGPTCRTSVPEGIATRRPPLHGQAVRVSSGSRGSSPSSSPSQERRRLLASRDSCADRGTATEPSAPA